MKGGFEGADYIDCQKSTKTSFEWTAATIPTRRASEDVSARSPSLARRVNMIGKIRFSAAL